MGVNSTPQFHTHLMPCLTAPDRIANTMIFEAKFLIHFYFIRQARQDQFLSAIYFFAFFIAAHASFGGKQIFSISEVCAISSWRIFLKIYFSVNLLVSFFSVMTCISILFILNYNFLYNITIFTYHMPPTIKHTPVFSQSQFTLIYSFFDSHTD